MIISSASISIMSVNWKSYHRDQIRYVIITTKVIYTDVCWYHILPYTHFIRDWRFSCSPLTLRNLGLCLWLSILQTGNLLWWASCQIRKIAGCTCARNAGNVYSRRRLQKEPLVRYPGMHQATCLTHVPWWMSGSLTRGGGENVPGIPGACAPAILHIWQEFHDCMFLCSPTTKHQDCITMRATMGKICWELLIRTLIVINITKGKLLMWKWRNLIIGFFFWTVTVSNIANKG